MVGEEALENRALLELTRPIDTGIVRHWDDMQHVFDHAFKLLEIDPRDCQILLTQAPLNPKKNTERLLEIMFENYGFQCVYIAVQAVLTLYSQGIANLKEGDSDGKF